MCNEGFPEEVGRAPTPTGGVFPVSDVATAVLIISRALSSKSPYIDVPGPTDTDMSVASIPEVEMADKGDTLMLKISSISSVSGVP